MGAFWSSAAAALKAPRCSLNFFGAAASPPPSRTSQLPGATCESTDVSLPLILRSVCQCSGSACPRAFCRCRCHRRWRPWVGAAARRPLHRRAAADRHRARRAVAGGGIHGGCARGAGRPCCGEHWCVQRDDVRRDQHAAPSGSRRLPHVRRGLQAVVIFLLILLLISHVLPPPLLLST
jgi:hypothetical protein